MTGQLNLVSVGPGFIDQVTPAAERALKASQAVVGYDLYMKWIEPWLSDKQIFTAPLTHERDRAITALDLARGGATVSLISSGDIGVYAMAALAFDEMREDDTFCVNVVPGITAANACASLLGSPLSHDFATLSLSDLLCPWDWIEHRASHIAQADLSVVLYNVQSRQRHDGVYAILNLLLQHKRPDTVCGVVRNAYRPEQSVAIHTLQELLSLQFDMLTTLVIGNRFTKRKRNFIFTPRGYNAWPADGRDTSNSLAKQAVWVFAGTSDGNLLSRELLAGGFKVISSAATEYGAALAREYCPDIQVVIGGQGSEVRRQQLSGSSASAIVDATHPYAVNISQQLIELAKELSIPYIRFERESTLDASQAEVFSSIDGAAARAIEIGRRIFLSTGSKDLNLFLKAPGAQDRQWFTRIGPQPELLKQAIDMGIPRRRICAMQGPYSAEFNEALWKDWQIDCVITKDSGEAGGYHAKVQAAEKLNIPLLVIQRPGIDYPVLASSFSQVIHHLQSLGLKT